MRQRKPLSDLDYSSYVGTFPNHVYNMEWLSIKGLGGARGQISIFRIDFRCRPYNTCTAVRMCAYHPAN